MKQHSKRIGIIGLGIMGSIMARASVAAGHEVVGFDTLPAARARLRRAGGRALGSCTEVAKQADALICSLPSTAALHAVVADLELAGRPKAVQISEMARSVHCPTPLLDTCGSIYTAAMAMGLGEADTAATAEVLRAWRGIQMRAK